MSPIRTSLDAMLLSLAVLLGAAWITTERAAAICGDYCTVPVSCANPSWQSSNYDWMGCVGGGGCWGDTPCCCGWICWWEDEAGFCGNDDMETCEGSPLCAS